MKKPIFHLVCLITFVCSNVSFARPLLDPPPRKAVQAAREGGVQGGGGSTDEMPLFEIRQDLLRWIDAGGARALELPSNLTYEQYASDMKAWLEPGVVAITLTNDSSQILVNGRPKDCRSWVDEITERPQIVCLKSVLKKPLERQYQLLHHEFAALAGFEKNIGAASDYFVSLQITDSLEMVTIKRLVVRPPRSSPRIGCWARFAISLPISHFGHLIVTGFNTEQIQTTGQDWAQVSRQLRLKGYVLEPRPEDRDRLNPVDLVMRVILKQYPDDERDAQKRVDFLSSRSLTYGEIIRNAPSTEWRGSKTDGLLKYSNVTIKTYALSESSPTLNKSPRLERQIRQANRRLESAKTFSEIEDAQSELAELVQQRKYTGGSADIIQDFVRQIPTCDQLRGVR